MVSQQTLGARVEPIWFLSRYADGELVERMELNLNKWRDRLEAEFENWPKRNAVIHNKPVNACTPIYDAHYGCGLEPRYGAPLSLQGARMKTPKNGDCSDPFNLNVIQRIFMFAFDHRISSNQPL